MSQILLKFAAVAAGGAIGASLRFAIAESTHWLLGRSFPYGTLLVNLMGSFVIGYLLVLLPEGDEQYSLMRLLLITGVLGAFTTYSAFSVETLQLIHLGQWLRAGVNVALTLLLCFLAVWIGYESGRWFHAPGSP